jgi:hypothetical protein
MARIRTIKPDFFTDSEVGELDPYARLLFIALWTQADREGRLKDRPREIKIAAFPYDKVDIDALLGSLTGKNLIVRYKVGGERYIAIPTFTRHQRPHKHETASQIPAPQEFKRRKKPDIVRGKPGHNGSETDDNGTEPEGVGVCRDNNGKERNGREKDMASLRLAPETHTGDRALSPADSVMATRWAAKERKHPLPEAFAVTDEMRAWAAAEAPGVDVDFETEKFRDHARAGRRLLLDWGAGWRNWIRNVERFGGRAEAPNSRSRQQAIARIGESKTSSMASQTEGLLWEALRQVGQGAPKDLVLALIRGLSTERKITLDEAELKVIFCRCSLDEPLGVVAQDCAYHAERKNHPAGVDHGDVVAGYGMKSPAQ